jgi:hypothetical protein
MLVLVGRPHSAHLFHDALVFSSFSVRQVAFLVQTSNPVSIGEEREVNRTDACK